MSKGAVGVTKYATLHPVLKPTCTLSSLAPPLLQALPTLLLGLPTGLPQSALRLTGPLLDLPLKLRGQTNGAASSDVLLLYILQRQEKSRSLIETQAEKDAAVEASTKLVEPRSCSCELVRNCSVNS